MFLRLGKSTTTIVGLHVCRKVNPSSVSVADIYQVGCSNKSLLLLYPWRIFIKWAVATSRSFFCTVADIYLVGVATSATDKLLHEGPFRNLNSSRHFVGYHHNNSNIAIAILTIVMKLLISTSIPVLAIIATTCLFAPGAEAAELRRPQRGGGSG
jgi:hypothetical protein